MADGIATLDTLITSCLDSAEGFRTAAHAARAETLRVRFAGIARQRADFSAELMEHVEHREGRPAAAVNRSGALRPAWRDLGAPIRPRDDAALLHACEIGERTTLHRYELALAGEWPAPVRLALERHRMAVQEALLELSGLGQLRKTG